VDWLLTCVRSGHVPKNGTNNRLEDRIANKSIRILEYLLNNDFVFAMLYLAKHDDAGMLFYDKYVLWLKIYNIICIYIDLYLIIVNKCQEISQDVQNSMDTNIPHVHSVLM